MTDRYEKRGQQRFESFKKEAQIDLLAAKIYDRYRKRWLKEAGDILPPDCTQRMRLFLNELAHDVANGWVVSEHEENKHDEIL